MQKADTSSFFSFSPLFLDSNFLPYPSLSENKIFMENPVCSLILYSSWSSLSKFTGVVRYSPLPGDRILSELSTMTRLSWVALHGMAHNSTELGKPLCRDRQWSMKEGKLWEMVRDREAWHDAIHWVAESDTIWQLNNNQSAAYVTWGPPAFAGGQRLSVLSSPSPSRPGILFIAHSSPVFLSSLLPAFLLLTSCWCFTSLMCCFQNLPKLF